MSVTVDYLVVCSGEIDLSGEMGLIELLTEVLKNALESVDDEPPGRGGTRSSRSTIRYIKRHEKMRPRGEKLVAVCPDFQ